ncbi:unnamed protein product [Auanema sp. JU1783]|nr:unnamed protein product [Auanema sp. JU1783]
MTFVLWAFLATFRIVSVQLVQSWFVPDEVYQSSEVAHHLVYGHGHLSWEWHHALRSFIHPGLISLVFKLLQFFGLDSQVTLVNAPRLFHAILFSFADISFYSICKRLSLSSREAWFSFLTYLSSWFIFYCAPRTLSNSLETALTLIALNWYPFEGNRYRGSVYPYMLIGSITIIIRPTAALIWLVLGINHLFKSSNPFGLICVVVLPTVIPVLTGSFLLDSVSYAHPTFSLWNFLSFNVLEGGSAHFGVHPWHWYFTQGLTSVLTIQLLPAIMGVINSSITRLPFYVFLFYVVFHSLLPHKEQRFLLPIIPFLCIYAGHFFTLRSYRHLRAFVFWFMISVNVLVALYTGLRHQIGPYSASESVMRTLKPGERSNLLALMPCYSIPGYSFFHDYAEHIRQLDCSPDLNGLNQADEGDIFYSDPVMWLDKNGPLNYSHILLYEKLYEVLKDVLVRSHYSEYSCNGTVVNNPEYGEVMQFTGDQRQQIKDFLVKVGIVKEDNCKVHGF